MAPTLVTPPRSPKPEEAKSSPSKYVDDYVNRAAQLYLTEIKTRVPESLSSTVSTIEDEIVRRGQPLLTRAEESVDSLSELAAEYKSAATTKKDSVLLRLLKALSDFDQTVSGSETAVVDVESASLSNLLESSRKVTAHQYDALRNGTLVNRVLTLAESKLDVPNEKQEIVPRVTAVSKAAVAATFESVSSSELGSLVLEKTDLVKTTVVHLRQLANNYALEAAAKKGVVVDVLTRKLDASKQYVAVLKLNVETRVLEIKEYVVSKTSPLLKQAREHEKVVVMETLLTNKLGDAKQVLEPYLNELAKKKEELSVELERASAKVREENESGEFTLSGGLKALISAVKAYAPRSVVVAVEE